MEYLKQYESWLNIITILSFALISFHSNPFILLDNKETFKIKRWQYSVNGIGIFFTWLLQMFHMGRTPQYGLYVEVFKKVSKTFLNFFLTFIFLFVGFLGAFLVLFPANRGFAEISPLTFVKILVMMVSNTSSTRRVIPLSIIPLWYNYLL